MDIEIALAFATFKDAPKEVVEAADKFSENYMVLKKAQAQADIWNKQKRAAQDQNDVLLKEFKDAINRWDPLNLNDGAPIESAAVSASVVK
jgi:hypothetical protein